jgi:hypothetical protein
LIGTGWDDFWAEHSAALRRRHAADHRNPGIEAS